MKYFNFNAKKCQSGRLQLEELSIGDVLYGNFLIKPFLMIKIIERMKCKMYVENGLVDDRI